MDGAILDDDEWFDVGEMTDEQIDVYAQLHQLALAIWQQQSIINAQLSNISNAAAVVDWSAMQNAASAIGALRMQFDTLRKQIDSSNQLGVLDRFVAQYGDWVSSVLNVLSLGATLPVGFFDKVADMLTAVEKSFLKSLVIPAVVLVGAFLFVRQAEGTRTYRKFVA